VRALTVQPVGGRTKVEAVGAATQCFYSRILSGEDLARVRVATEMGHDFGGRGEAFFLAMEAHRIRYAYQFDPLFAIYQLRQGEMRLISSSALWDLDPSLQEQGTMSQPSEDTVVAYAIEQMLESYRTELLQQRERDAAIKRKYGLRSLEQVILDAEARLIEYETRPPWSFAAKWRGRRPLGR